MTLNRREPHEELQPAKTFHLTRPFSQVAFSASSVQQPPSIVLYICSYDSKLNGLPSYPLTQRPIHPVAPNLMANYQAKKNFTSNLKD